MSKKYLYDDYVRRLSQRFAARLDEIQAEHGFEYGYEFEIAICQILRAALPQKYGICRGYVVSADGKKAGDDIIIYSRDRFPTLRFNVPDDYSLKEKIPIEAVYAYVEAKHTLVLTGTGPSSLDKACRQVASVKELVSKRKPRDLVTSDPYVTDELKALPESSKPLHSIRNPIYGVVLSRYVRENGNGDRLQADETAAALRKHDPNGQSVFPEIPIHLFPDLIVAGDGVVILPCALVNGKNQPTFFNQSDTRSVAVEQVPNVAFGAAFCSLFFALDWIRLGRMPFPEIIGDALNLKVNR